MNHLPPDIEALLFDATAGDLTPEDSERLRALMEADPGLAVLLDEQRMATAELGTAAMTQLERARLHRVVIDAVVPTTPAAAPATWHRWAFAVAAVALVVVAGGFALLGGGTGDRFDDAGGELTSAPALEADGADGAGGTEDTEEAARTEDEAATGLAPEAEHDAAADRATPGFPACEGEMEPLGDSTYYRVTTEVWQSPAEAAAALDAAADDAALDAGDPVVEVVGGVAVVSWFDDGTLLQQVELLDDSGSWHASRRVTCSR